MSSSLSISIIASHVISLFLGIMQKSYDNSVLIVMSTEKNVILSRTNHLIVFYVKLVIIVKFANSRQGLRQNYNLLWIAMNVID